MITSEAWTVRTGWLDAAQRAADHRTGLAPHYPLLYACVLGLRAQRVLEFGTGESSHVLVNALRATGGKLISVAPEAAPGYEPGPHWYHEPGLSETVWTKLPTWGPYDLVLHDGSHSAAVASEDLYQVLVRVRPGGLIVVHDVLHSYSGPDMQRAIRSLKAGGCTRGITLPFAFGLTIVQVVTGSASMRPVQTDGLDKPSSPHRTLEWQA